MTIEIVNLWFSIFEESNIENHDCECLIFNFQCRIKIKWTKTTRSLKWSPYWFLILVNSGFRNINLAANIPLLFTSCLRILKCLIVNCPMWSTVQNISQSRKRCFPHDPCWSCPWQKYWKPLYVLFLPLSIENTSTRSLLRSSL